MRPYVSNPLALAIVGTAIAKSQTPGDRLKEELCESIKKVRAYVSNERAGFYSHIADLPCGQQDAFYDKVDDLFKKHRELAAAYELRFFGTAKRLQYFLNMALEVQS